MSINRLCSIKRLKPTVYVMHQQVKHSRILHSAPNLFMCFIFISKQMATFAPYSINWLVFITKMKSVYCAVRTGSLNKAVCASYLKDYAAIFSKYHHPIFSHSLGISFIYNPGACPEISLHSHFYYVQCLLSTTNFKSAIHKPLKANMQCL